MPSFRNLTPASVMRSPAVIFFLLACVFFADLFLTGKTFLLRDGYFTFVKAEQYGWQTLANGGVPFWDTGGMGRPFIENPCPSFFYPVSVVFGIFSAGMAINLFCLLNLWLLGLGVYFFARQMQLERWPSLAAGASIMFGTFATAYMEFLSALAALPWIFFILGVLARFYHLTFEEGNSGVFSVLWRQRRLLAVMVLLFALSFSTNYFEFLVYPFIGYGLFILLAAVSARSWRMLVSMVLFFGVAGILAILLVMPQLALLWHYLPFSERTAAFDTRFDMASLSAVHLLKAVFPMIGGKPGYPNVYWSPGTFEFCISTFYTGALALLALPFAFLKSWKERSRTERLLVTWGVILAAFGLIIALGNNTPIYPLLWKYAPLMNKLRFASKFLLLLTTGEALLIALGIQYILKTTRPLAKRAVVVLWSEAAVVLLMGALWLLVNFNPSLMPRIFGYTGTPIPGDHLAAVLPSLAWSYVFLLLAFGWIAWTLRCGTGRASAPIAVTLVLANLWIVSRPVQPTGPIGIYNRVPEMTRHVADSRFRAFSTHAGAHQYLYADLRPDIYEWALEAGVNAAWYPYPNVNSLCQNGIKLQKFNVWMSGIYNNNPSVRNNFLDAAGVRWVVGGAPWQQILWGNASRRLQVNVRESALPRFMLYTGWKPISNDDDALKYLHSVPGDQLRQYPAIEETALLHGRETRCALPPPSAPSLRGTLTVIGEGNHWLEYKSNNSARQLLVVSDTWYPGWRATVDGNEVPVHRTNYMFRGVFVPAGEHTVRFDFWPVNLGWYCTVSIFGMLIVIALFIRRRRQ